MRRDFSHVNTFRVREGRLASSPEDGACGAFIMPCGPNRWMQIISSDGMDWDHVSVVMIGRNRRPLYRTPTWEEMCRVKDLFFEKDEDVLQYHPRQANYRNAHPYCLHLWRPQTAAIPLPDPMLVAHDHALVA